MIFSNKHISRPLNLIFGTSVTLVQEHKHLGITLSSDLKWKKHISIIVIKALQKIGSLYRVRAYLTRKQLENIY